MLKKKNKLIYSLDIRLQFKKKTCLLERRARSRSLPSCLGFWLTEPNEDTETQSGLFLTLSPHVIQILGSQSVTGINNIPFADMTTNNLGIIFNIWPVFGFYMQVILFFLKGAKKKCQVKNKTHPWLF